MPSDKFLPIEDGCRPVIEYWHKKVHDGTVYNFHYENFALASSASIYIDIRTGDKEVHLQDEWQVLGGTLQVQWYGEPTLGTVGTSINTINRNRNFKDNHSLTTMSYGPTVTTVGTVLFGAKALLGSATNQSKAGTNIVAGAERVLLHNQNYLIKFTAVGAIQFTVDGLFYEEEVE